MLPPAGVIALAFTGLYLVEAGYFTGLLFAAEEIRGKDYKSEPPPPRCRPCSGTACRA